MYQDFQYLHLCNNRDEETLRKMADAVGIKQDQVSRESLCDLFRMIADQLQETKGCQNDEESAINGIAISELPNYLKYPIKVNDKIYCYHIGDLEKEIINGNARDHYNRIVFSPSMRKEILDRCKQLKILLNVDRVDELFGVEARSHDLLSERDRRQTLIDLWVELDYPVIGPEEYANLASDVFNHIANAFIFRFSHEDPIMFSDKYTLAKFVLENKDAQPFFEYSLEEMKEDVIESMMDKKKQIIRDLFVRLGLSAYGFVAFGRLDLFKLTKDQVQLGLAIFHGDSSENEVENLKKLVDCIDSSDNLRLMNAYILEITQGEQVVERFIRWVGGTKSYKSFLNSFSGVEEVIPQILLHGNPGFNSQTEKSVYQDCLLEIMENPKNLREIEYFIKQRNH